MRTDELLQLDIKLLVAFHTIIEEGSVSRAAERLGVTQPALSKSLQKLRSVFNDALFSRQAYGLSPTARASELHLQIEPILHSLSSLTSPPKLDLSELHRHFCLHIHESVLASFIEPLLSEIYAEAPNVKLSISNWGTQSFYELNQSTVDLGIGMINGTPNNVRSKLIGHIEGCILISRAHPLFNKDKFETADLVNYPLASHHIQRHAMSPSITLQKLQQQGFDIMPNLETESLLAAMKAIKNGMTLVTGYATANLMMDFMASSGRGDDIKLMPLPEDIVKLDPYDNQHPVQMCWHERNNNDLSHKWLREKIANHMKNSPWMINKLIKHI
ncbi:MAG: LysR family transcriptional regulator [Marinomonas sp.]|uniref:LysR family transcriptional regulator n=1 Tax=Marinomonas sp. S3726 TaxID=579484 RepID=UPI0005FA44F1|nr:LysR family transcriptional regulator [Marinomonas sp. S3726]KJZ15999.1 LysR family transcriptional regulator [Marinomonas sp. S3726]